MRPKTWKVFSYKDITEVLAQVSKLQEGKAGQETNLEDNQLIPKCCTNNICIKHIVISSDWAISSRSEKVQAWCRSGTHLGLSAIVLLWQDVHYWQKVFNIKWQEKLHISCCSIIEEITSALVNPKILQFKGIKFSHSKSPK